MEARTVRRNLERTRRRSRTRLDRSRYKHQCHLCNRMMTKAKSKFLADVITENSDNPRRLRNSINNILYRIPPPAQPEFTSVKSLCDHFSKYFVDKIEIIRSKFLDKDTIFHLFLNVRQKLKLKSFFELIVKIMWSGPHSYKCAEKLFWYINNSHHWYNQHFNGN